MAFNEKNARDKASDNPVFDESWFMRQRDVLENIKKYEAHYEAHAVFKVELQEGLPHLSQASLEKKLIRGNKSFSRSEKDGQSVICMKTGDGEPRTVFTLGDGQTLEWDVSPEGKYLIVKTAQGGEEMGPLSLIDLSTKKAIKITRSCNSVQSAWTKDEKTFFYFRHPDKDTVPAGEEKINSAICTHHMVDNAQDASPTETEDEQVFAKDPYDMHTQLTMSPDGQDLVIGATTNFSGNSLSLLNTETMSETTLVEQNDSRYSLVFLGDSVYIFTNKYANCGKVLRAPLSDWKETPVDNWKTVIFEKKDQLIEKITTAGNMLIVHYSWDGNSTGVDCYAHHDDGMLNLLETILPPPNSFISEIYTEDSNDFALGVDTYIAPREIWKCSSNKGKIEINEERVEPYYKPDDYVVDQIEYSSADGTNIPITIIRNKNTPQPTSIIVEAYGCYNVSENPTFRDTWMPWCKFGGAIAIVHLPGGGERGEQWHKKGIGEHKQDAVGLLLATGDFLKKEYKGAKVGLMGRSGGGYLALAALTQKPEAFDAVCAKVPIADTNIIDTDPFQKRNEVSGEWPKPGSKKHYNPLENIKQRENYAPTMIVTSLDDPRIPAPGSLKFVDELQKCDPNQKHCIIIEQGTGHGLSTPPNQLIETQATMFAFFAENLELKTKPA